MTARRDGSPARSGNGSPVREPAYVIDDVQWIQYSLTRLHDEERRLREMVLDATERGVISQRELAKRLGVSHGTIGNWVDLARTERDRAS